MPTVQSTDMVLVDNLSFISSLERLTTGERNDSSFTVTFKRFNGHEKPKPKEGKPPLDEPDEYLCLIRARIKAKKISTVVKREDVPKMLSMYAQFMKNNMDGLKRVKKVKSKTKATKG